MKNPLLVTAVLLSILILFVGGIGVLVSSAEEPASPATPGFVLPRKHPTGLTRGEQRGRNLYEYYCALCHGETGNGDGFNSYNLSTPPTKHSDPVFMATLSDSQIRKIIKEGGPSLGRSPEMPPWGKVLTDRQIKDVTAFIRTLSASHSPQKGP